eukprot:1183897-Prorocentrum_minimum.AAC.4
MVWDLFHHLGEGTAPQTRQGVERFEISFYIPPAIVCWFARRCILECVNAIIIIDYGLKLQTSNSTVACPLRVALSPYDEVPVVRAMAQSVSAFVRPVSQRPLKEIGLY